MSTRTAALPVERAYLLKAWLVVATFVIAAATVIALAVAAGDDASGRGTDPSGPANGRIENVEVGRTYPNGAGGFVVSGELCAQCR